MSDVIGPSERDWVEDFELENGQYICQCSLCGQEFTGYKRRVLCRRCHHANTPELTHLRAENAALRERVRAAEKIVRLAASCSIPVLPMQAQAYLDKYQEGE